jgi:lysostaphin
MVGLVISMGAPNLLLTRQSDRAPAAEAISNEPTASSDPVKTTEVAKNGSVNLVEPKAVEPVSVAASSRRRTAQSASATQSRGFTTCIACN